MKSPAFQFYPGDWLGSQRVQLMSLEEEGAYFRLLCYCWLHGSIPAVPTLLSRLVGKALSDESLTTVIGMFVRRGDRLVHDRLEAEREKQERWRKKSSLGGKVGGGDPRGIALRRIRNSIRGLVRLGCPPHVKDADFDETLVSFGYTMRTLGDHLEAQFQGGMTWSNYGDFWTIDHAEARCEFNLNDEKEFLSCWAIENLRPMLRTANASKGGRSVDRKTANEKLTLLSSSPSSNNTGATGGEFLEHQIYEAYPRKESRATGIKAIKKIIDAQPLFGPTLLERTRAYADAVSKWPEQDRRYVPLAATWFNGERYNDDPSNWRRNANDRTSNSRGFEQSGSYAGVTDK